MRALAPSVLLDGLPRPARAVGVAFGALNRWVAPSVKAGVGSPLPLGAGLVVLETTGRRTGLARQVPLVAVRLGHDVVVTTVRPRSLWVANAEAAPAVKVWLWGRPVPARAEVRRGPLQVVRLRLVGSAPEHGPHPAGEDDPPVEHPEAA